MVKVRLDITAMKRDYIDAVKHVMLHHLNKLQNGHKNGYVTFLGYDEEDSTPGMSLTVKGERFGKAN